MKGNIYSLQFTCKHIDQMRAAKCAIKVNLKCRNDKFAQRAAENKVKPSNIENNLVNAYKWSK